jgi:hypothetical protein
MANDPEAFIRNLIPHNLPLAARCAASPEVEIGDDLNREIQQALIAWATMTAILKRKNRRTQSNSRHFRSGGSLLPTLNTSSSLTLGGTRMNGGGTRRRRLHGCAVKPVLKGAKSSGEIIVISFRASLRMTFAD